MLKIHLAEVDLSVLMIGISVHVVAVLSYVLRLWRRQRQMATARDDCSIFYKHRSDLFAVIAFVLSIANSLIVWLEVGQGSGDEGPFMAKNKRWDMNFERFLLAKYISDILCTLANGATKLSITSFFVEQIHALHPQRPGLLKATRFAAYWTVAFALVNAFQCSPTKKAWMIDVEGSCIDINFVRVCQFGISLYLDMVLLALPIKFLRLIRTNRLELGLIVCLGFVVCAVSLYSTVMTPTWMGELVQGTSYQGLLWPVIELYLRIIYANSPFLYAVYTGETPISNKP